MPTVLNAKTRKCDVLTNGPIAELNFVTGPVYKCKLTTPQIIKLVSNGRIVEEIDPRNPKNKVRLTIATCGKSVFDEIVPEPKVEEKPPVVEIPKEVVLPTKETEAKVVETDPHKIFLKEIGYTEEQWRKLSKSERRRIKQQHNSHAEQNQDVKEQIETHDGENEVELEECSATTESDENALVIETQKIHETEEKPVVEEAVVSADM